MSFYLRILFGLFVLIPYTLIGLPIQMILIALNLPGWQFLPSIWFKLVCFTFQIHVRVIGECPDGQPTLILSNHTSWMDIPVIASIKPRSFIAKKEVGEWPVISLLSKLQRTIYVDRSSRIGAEKSARQIGDRMAAGEGIILFPEGTSGHGTHVLPFKSALVGSIHKAIEAIDTGQVYIQPMVIAYTHIQGLPIGRVERTKVAWVGDMELGPHAWDLLKVGHIDATIVFGKPVPVKADMDRKQLTKEMEEAVRTMLVDVSRQNAKDMLSLYEGARA